MRAPTPPPPPLRAADKGEHGAREPPQGAGATAGRAAGAGACAARSSARCAPGAAAVAAAASSPSEPRRGRAQLAGTARHPAAGRDASRGEGRVPARGRWPAGRGEGRGAGPATNRHARRHRAAGKLRLQEGGRCALGARQSLQSAALCLSSGRAGVRGRAPLPGCSARTSARQSGTLAHTPWWAWTESRGSGLRAGTKPTLCSPIPPTPGRRPPPPMPLQNLKERPSEKTMWVARPLQDGEVCRGSPPAP